MVMSKVKISKFIKGLSFKVERDCLLVYFKRSFATFGRMVPVECPCCQASQRVSKVLLYGTGKRCLNCNTLLSSRGAVISLNDITANELNSLRLGSY